MTTNGSGNDMVPSGNKPLSEPILTQFYVVIWRHWATMCLITINLINYTPAPPKMEWGILDSPRCLSVRPSVDKVSGTFWKKLLARFVSYLAFTLMGWVSWPLFIFVFLASFFLLLVAKYLAEMGFPELFEKKTLLAQFISCLAFTLMGEFLDHYTFSGWDG